MQSVLELPSLMQIRSTQAKRSFHRFVLEAWPVVEYSPFVDGWHIQLLCNALERVYKRDIRNLYINVPPGSMKTLLTAVFYPAWVWTNDPRRAFMCVSYSEKLENKASRKCRTLIESDWYKHNFGVQLSDDNNQVSEYSNTKGGVRYSVGLTGTLTGRHADDIIMDDLISAADADSDVELEKANSIYDDVIPSRLREPKQSAKIIICQRLSNKDIIGHIENRREHYEKIILPEEYEGVRYTSDYPELNDPRKKEGELLWPERMGLKEVSERKVNMSTLGYSGQYQQRPVPAGGHVFQREWFTHRLQNENIIARIISIDTSFGTSKVSDYSTILVGELRSDYTLFIRDLFRARLEYPQLVVEVERVAKQYEYKLKKILIESKASGISLIQSLNQSSLAIHQIEANLGIQHSTLIAPINPTDNKYARANLVSNFCEKGMIILPPPSPQAEWLNVLEEELFSFPMGMNDDVVDGFTQLLHFLAPQLGQGLRAKYG
jgi:predicted phage terminase large subunit-like protein